MTSSLGLGRGGFGLGIDVIRGDAKRVPDVRGGDARREHLPNGYRALPSTGSASWRPDADRGRILILAVEPTCRRSDPFEASDCMLRHLLPRSATASCDRTQSCGNALRAYGTSG